MTRDQIKTALRNNGIYFPTSLIKKDLEKIYNDNLDARGILKSYKEGEYKRPEDLYYATYSKTKRQYAEDEVPTNPSDALLTEQEQIDEVDENEPATSMDDLFGKIENAELPPQQEKPEPPLFEATKQKKKKGASSPDSFRVEGYILMLVVDTVFPFSLAVINNMLDKRNKIEAHQLSLSETDFAKLTPLADQAADYLAINLNPVAGFFLTASFMYGSNLMTIRMQTSTKV